jgi:glycerophosphoryl diester phosphodiesterase
MNLYYGDNIPELRQEHQAKIHYLEEMCSTLKEILENVKWRHQNIKNMIEWRKFTSGVYSNELITMTEATLSYSFSALPNIDI